MIATVAADSYSISNTVDILTRFLNTSLFIFIVVVIIGFLWVLYMLTHAPMGYEDEKGYHSDESKNNDQ